MSMPEGTVPPSTGKQAAARDVGGVRGMAGDASTLAATGLLAAVLFAVVAGLLNAADAPSIGDELRTRLMALTETVDVGDVALIGLAVALCLLTPDPAGGLDRGILLKVATALGGVIAVFGVIRSIVLLTGSADLLVRIAGFLATLGVATAAATVAFYAAREVPLHKEGMI